MSRTSWRTNSFRPRNMPARVVGPHVPVQDDLAGLLRALLDEKAALQGTRLIASTVEPGSGDLRLIRLSGECLARVREEMQGWDAYGPLSGIMRGKEEDASRTDWWRGEVVTVDFEHRALVLEVEGAGPPREGGVFFVKEPDYQEQVRRWAERRIEARKAEHGAAYKWLAGDRESSPKPGAVEREAMASLLQDFGLRPQQLAAALGPVDRLSLIWGPPGTGKTFTLGAMVAALSMKGIKVLVLAPTNVAVDQACLAIDDARVRLGSPLFDGDLIRAGRPQLQELEERPHLMAWTRALKEYSESVRGLRKQVMLLEKQLSHHRGVERDRANMQLAEFRKQLKDLEVGRSQMLWTLAQGAKIIATTLAAGLAHEAIRQSLAHCRYALVFDEASMVPRYVLPPFLEHPPAHLTMAGDFRQLGPVKRNNNPENENCTHWVGHSAFETAGLRSEGDIERLEHAGVLHMLEHQSRMNEGLCAPVSDLYYGGRLVTVGTPPDPPALAGWPETPCLVVNPERTPLPSFAPATVYPERDGRENRWEKSAWIAVGIAEELLRQHPEKSVLLLSPFRNQADLLRKLARAHLSRYPHVRAGTVHVSQGHEADLVIFDPVNPRHGWLVERFGKGDAPRLFCVAFSRPKQQVVLLCRRAELVDNRHLKSLARDGVDWVPWGGKSAAVGGRTSSVRARLAREGR